jgi:hypothetical protein
MMRERTIGQDQSVKGISHKKDTGFTLRALLIGFAMLFFMCVITYEMRSSGYFFGIPFSPIIQVFYFIFGPNMSSLMPMMLVIAIVNPILMRFKAERKFSTKELVVINVIAGIGGLAIQIPVSLMLYAPIVLTRNSVAKGTGIWMREEILSGLSPLAFINDPDFIMRIAEGGNPVEWGAWLPRLFVWFVFLGAAYYVNVCLVVLVRRRWTEVEHLPYPVARFQVALIKGKTGFEIPGQDSPSIWKSNLLWLGFIIGGLWAFPTCIAQFIHGVPYVDHNRLNAIKQGMLSSSPILKTAEGGVTPIVNPLIIGLLWYTPLDLLFSIWFFSAVRFWMTAFFLSIGANWTGFVQGSVTSVMWMRRDSGVGAIVALGLFYLWLQRAELKRIISGVFRGEDLGDKDEPMSYRKAVFGIIIGTIIILLFSTMILQVSLGWSLLYVFMVMIGSLGIGRMRAETGTVHQTLLHEYMGQFLVNSFGNNRFSFNTLRGMGFLDATLPFSSVLAAPVTALEAWEMGDEVGTPRKTITRAFLLSLVGAFVLITVYSLPVLYKNGRALLIDTGTYGFWVENSLSQTMNLSKEVARRDIQPQFHRIIWPIISAVFVFILGFFRNRFAWWPFHPVGWAIGFSHHATWFAFMALLVWIVKFLVTRYGGMSLFKKMTPIFVGISLAQVANGFLYVIMILLKLGKVIV